MDIIPYLETIGRLLGWPAAVVATILGFVLRDLSKRVSKLEMERATTENAIKASLSEALMKVTQRLEKLESADTSIKEEFKGELNKIYEKINKMSEDVAVLRDRSDRKKVPGEED